MITYPGNVVAFCGRRFGKTDGYVQRLFYWMQRNPGLYWWVGLSWRSASLKRAWRETTAIARRVLNAVGLDARSHINRSNFEIRLPGLGEIWFRTGDNPTSLAGEGIQGAIVDEFSLMQEIVWTEYLEATLLDYKGWAAFAGVPKGNNWASNLWRSAADRDGWVQLHATSYENPFIDGAAIDEIRDHSTTRFFEQEYLAKIMSGEGAVFRNIAACCILEPGTPAEHEGHNLVMGVDWGKTADYTVCSVGCRDCACEVELDRFHGVDYRLARQRLAVLAERWGVYDVLAESNAMGEPIIEEMWAQGLPVRGFQTTAASKPPLIENLSLALEREEVHFIDDPIATAELEAFEMRTNANTGRPTYSAPEGIHDDTVIARALMCRALSLGGGWIAEI